MFSLCGSTGNNTGAIDCDPKRGLPKGIVLGSGSFNSTDYATSASFQAAFVAKMKLATGNAQKLYPFPEIQGTNDKTDANKEGSLGYGLKFILLKGKPAYEFDMVPGTAQEQEMLKWHNKDVPVFVFDDASQVWGKKDTSGNYVGAKCKISVTAKPFEDGQNPKATKVTISYINTDDFEKNAWAAQTSFSIGDLIGLVDAVLSEISAHTTNVFHITADIVTTLLGKSLKVFDYFAALMANAANWSVIVDATGVTHTITSVAQNTGGKGWDLTLDNTQYTALSAGAKLRFAFADPTTLDTAGVTGVETPNYLITVK